MTTSMPTADFLARLGPDDIVFTELGGQNDRFCIAAARQKIKLVRLPTWIVSDEQKRQRIEEKKKGDEVEKSVSILYRNAAAQPEKFYPFREVEDMSTLEVRLLSRMYWTVQRKIRIAAANRLRHIQQDIEFLGGLKGLPVARKAIDLVMETLPADEEVEVNFDATKSAAVKFYKSLEYRLNRALEAKLEEMPLYHAVFGPIQPRLLGIAGYVIASIQDIRRFPKFSKLKAFAAYHLIRNKDGDLVAPLHKNLQPGDRANWNHVLQQAVYYFTLVVDKQQPDNIWKQQLQRRYRVEIGKLLEAGRNAGREIPADMTIDVFLSFVAGERAKAGEEKTIVKLPEPFKGIPVVARRRALRWLGQKFLQYIFTEWRRFEGLEVEASVGV